MSASYREERDAAVPKVVQPQPSVAEVSYQTAPFLIAQTCLDRTCGLAGDLEVPHPPLHLVARLLLDQARPPIAALVHRGGRPRGRSSERGRATARGRNPRAAALGLDAALRASACNQNASWASPEHQFCAVSTGLNLLGVGGSCRHAVDVGMTSAPATD